MNGNEILRIVDAIHRDKAISMDVVFEGIEQAILSAARKHFSEEEKLEVRINRQTGEPALICDGRALEAELLGDLLGRISAQTAKQVMIQKMREAERDSLYEEFLEQRSQHVRGTVTRVDRGTVIVKLDNLEAILPRSEQIRKENFRPGDRVRAIVLDVRKAGSRVRVILSRTHPDFVRRLFEIEIPEVSERLIEVRSIAREAGNRSKVAVSCATRPLTASGPASVFVEHAFEQSSMNSPANASTSFAGMIPSPSSFPTPCNRLTSRMSSSAQCWARSSSWSAKINSLWPSENSGKTSGSPPNSSAGTSTS
jgi:N utilization substance protein A